MERLWKEAHAASDKAGFGYNDRWGRRKTFDNLSLVGKAVEMYMERTDFPKYQIVRKPAGPSAWDYHSASSRS